MDTVQNKSAWVVGEDAAAASAAALLQTLGARVRAVGPGSGPGSAPDFAVHGCQTPADDPVLAELRRQSVPVISELELGYRHSLCLHVAILGTNGKSTTARWLLALLEHVHRRVLLAGGHHPSVSALANQTRELDYLLVEVEWQQLAGLEFYRAPIAVLLNLTTAPPAAGLRGRSLDHAASLLFCNQQAFDWGVVQAEAAQRLRAAGLELPGKVVTFSAADRRADLYLDRGLIVSRLPDWTGPLLDTARCRALGPHFAEDLMAVLAVGRVLRIPLETMVEVLSGLTPPPHCLELVATIEGVRYVDDGAAVNLDAMQKAVMAASGPGETQNVVLLAGGEDGGWDYHDAGPVLARKVKHALVFGPVAERLRAAWSLFTPCSPLTSLLEAVQRSAEIAGPGDVVLFSPACSSHGALHSAPHGGDAFRHAVLTRVGTQGGCPK